MTCLKEKKESAFYKSLFTRVWNYSNKRVLFCKECMDSLMVEYAGRYGEQTALAICCALVDAPFYAALYKSITENNSIFNLGLYLRILNGKQYQMKSFLNSIVDGELGKTSEEVKNELETKWSKADKRNMEYVISVVGYDPFDDCGMTQSDRKDGFNILAGYCDNDGIKEDGHKIQSVVQITQSHIQCRKLDEFINEELLSSHPDETRVKNLTATKKQLLDSIAKAAQDNNLSSAYNDRSDRGINTLTKKMKEMAEDDFEAIKVNLMDIKKSEAILQVANLSNQSIMAQLGLDDNDYTEMIKEQRVIIQKYESEHDDLIEENRILKNKIQELEQKKKR